MKKRILKGIGGATAAILGLAIFTLVWNPVQAQSDQGLVGSWSVEITVRDCQSGTPFFSFPALVTFNQGGTMEETDLGSPNLVRLPGQGVWGYGRGGQFSAAFQFLNFNPDRSPAGRNVVRSTITIGPGGNTYTATDIGQILNPNGEVINTGCATETAKRFQ